jgi:hypothetical protein
MIRACDDAALRIYAAVVYYLGLAAIVEQAI